MKNKSTTHRRTRQQSGAALISTLSGYRLGIEACVAFIVVLLSSGFLALTYSIFWEFDHQFSDCLCFTYERQAQQSIRRYKPVGLNENELVRLLGNPTYVKDFEDDEKLDKIWDYPKLRMLLRIKDHRCTTADCDVYVYH